MIGTSPGGLSPYEPYPCPGEWFQLLLHLPKPVFDENPVTFGDKHTRHLAISN